MRPNRWLIGVFSTTTALVAPRSGASVERRCEIAWLRVSPAKQVGSLPARYAHLLEDKRFARYRSVAVVEERLVVYVDTEAKLLEFPSFPKEHAVRVHTRFLGASAFRAEPYYAKQVTILLGAPSDVPRPFVSLTSDGGCVVAASETDCWVLTLRAAPTP